jgi:hypothetical protein
MHLKAKKKRRRIKMPRSIPTDQQSGTSQKLQIAEQHAEQRVEELEERIQALENSRQPQPSKKSDQQQDQNLNDSDESTSEEESLQGLRNEPMMDHLLNALASGRDIGHYGRLVFAMVGPIFCRKTPCSNGSQKIPV